MPLLAKFVVVLTWQPFDTYSTCQMGLKAVINMDQVLETRRFLVPLIWTVRPMFFVRPGLDGFRFAEEIS